MQESLVKLLLIVIGVVALVLGVVFLLFPGWFVTFSGSEPMNVGWLRTIGGGMVALQGFGLLIASVRRRDTNPILAVAAVASLLQSIGLWIAVFSDGYTAEKSWTTIVPGILATVASVLLVAAWLSRRRSVGDLSAKATKGPAPESPAASADEGAPGPS